MSVETIETNLVTSVTDFQRDYASIIETARVKAKPVAIMSRSKICGYFVPVEALNNGCSLDEMLSAKNEREKSIKRKDDGK